MLIVAWFLVGAVADLYGQPKTEATAEHPKIVILDPPEQGFYSKVLYFHGIPIKSHLVVSNEALHAAYDRLALLFTNLLTKQPMVVSNLVAAGAELHLIGRNQVTTDLPEWRQDKHVPLDEYNGVTRDRRTRGMGGLITSCGEENVLRLPREQDRYFGRDICLHEFSHNIEGNGMTPEVRSLFNEQYQKSKEKGLWLNSYAGSNPNEYFAELTMWYFGTHGDMNMTGPKPENGPEGLKKYDPDAYALFDHFYSGQIDIGAVEPRIRRFGGTNGIGSRPRRDSLVARGIVARLSSYKVGETKLSEFFADAGMAAAGDEGGDGWHVTLPDTTAGEATSATNAVTSAAPAGSRKFRVWFRDPRNRDHSLADLEFRAGVLTGFVWNN
jgi:hypothetical protein